MRSDTYAKIKYLKSFFPSIEKYQDLPFTEDQLEALDNMYQAMQGCTIFPDKKNLRETYRKKRDELTPAQIEEYSSAISRLFLGSESYNRAKTIFTYISFGQEFDTSFIISQAFADKKHLVVPVVQGKTMVIVEITPETVYRISKFGIREPAELIPFPQERIDLVLLPGLVFTSLGYRVGYGGGYYDRFMSSFTGETVGLVFPGFIDNRFIPNHYDMPADHLITL